MGSSSRKRRSPYDVCIVHMADARFYPFFQRQAFTLRDNGYRVAFVSWQARDGEGDPAWPGIDVFPVTINTTDFSGKLFFARYAMALRALLRGVPARLYQAVDPVTLWPVRIAARRHGARYAYFSLEYFQGVTQLVGRPLTRAAWYVIERTGARGACTVSSVCDTMSELIGRSLGIPRPHVIRNVPPASEYQGSEKGQLRSAIGLESRVPLCVYKGDLGVGRGLELFIRAMPRFPELHFALIGEGPLGPALREAARDAAVERRAHFVGRLPSDMFAAYLRDGDLGHVIHENTGLNMRITLPSKIFDYMHAGLPVISGNGPEIGRLVREHDIGWVVDPSSVDNVAGGIASFLDARPRLGSWRDRCRAAASSYCWELEHRKYLEWVRAALDGDV